MLQCPTGLLLMHECVKARAHWEANVGLPSQCEPCCRWISICLLLTIDTC